MSPTTRHPNYHISSHMNRPNCNTIAHGPTARLPFFPSNNLTAFLFLLELNPSFRFILETCSIIPFSATTQHGDICLFLHAQTPLSSNPRLPETLTHKKNGHLFSGVFVLWLGVFSVAPHIKKKKNPWV